MIRALGLYVPLQIMRYRRAVLQNPSKSSVLPRLPLHKSRPLLTPSKSTLPQVLIPVHFNSPRIKSLQKTAEAAPVFARARINIISLALRFFCFHALTHCFAPRNPSTLFPSITSALFPQNTGGWVPLGSPFTLVIPSGARDLLLYAVHVRQLAGGSPVPT